jgi:prepilin-type processing-associated H-X9-DG protein
MQYVGDNDEYFPSNMNFQFSDYNGVPGGVWYPADPNASGFALVFVQQILHPYHKSVQIMVCPDALRGDNPDPGGASPLERAPYGGNYGVNYNLFTWPSQVDANAKRVQLSGIKSASKLFAMMDAGNFVVDCYAFSTCAQPYGYFWYIPGVGDVTGTDPVASWPPPVNSQAIVDDYKHGRHFGGINITYADGHVKWLRTDRAMQAVRLGALDPASE